MNSYKRLLQGVGANFMGKMWVVVAQLLSIPIMTYSWGLEGFGAWMMITTIPSYIVLADMGVGTAAAVEMTRLVSIKDEHKAKIVFQSAWSFISIIITIFVTIIAVSSYFYSANVDLNLNYKAGILTGSTLLPIIIFLCISTVISSQVTILKTVFRSSGYYTRSTIVSDLFYLIEQIAVITSVYAGGDMLIASILMSVIRLISYAHLHYLLKRKVSWWSFEPKLTNVAIIKSLMKPSIGAFFLLLSNTVATQGILLVIGLTFGPAQAASFSIARTISKVPLQFGGMFNRASIPELTHAFAVKDHDSFRNLYKINIAANLAFCMPFLIILPILGQLIVDLISSDDIYVGGAIFLVMSLTALISSVASASSTPLISTNNHWRFSIWSLILYTVCTAVIHYSGVSYMESLMLVLAVEAIIFIVVIVSLKGQLNK